LGVDRHSGCDVAQHGGLVEEAAQIVAGLAAAQHGGAGLDGGADLGGHRVAQVAAGHRAHVGAWCFGVTDLKPPGVVDDQLGELVGHRRFDDEPFGGDAALPGIEEPAAHGQVGDPRQIGVGQHHERVRPAQLQHRLFDLPAGDRADRAARAFAAGDGDRPDAGVGDQPFGGGRHLRFTQASDREILNLLTRRARTLHLGVANYCWFTDPSRALCLKLAGTPTADRPLAGMCDSARCPQATHHPHHRPIWAEHAEQTKTFLGSLGTTRRTDRTRLQADYDRALRVIADIDAAAAATASEDQA
jgi:hypothetical protein